MNDLTATIFDIQRSSFVDGPGIRTAVFFKGCNLRCAWCHNPEGQAQEAEWMLYPHKCVGCGNCATVDLRDEDFVCRHGGREICGRMYTVDGILREIMKDARFYEASGGGVTLSGGECLLQIDFAEALLKACKENGIHTAVDTAGHVPYESIARISPYTDLFLYDVKCMDREKHKLYTGVDNGLILENLRRLLTVGASVWVRVPLIPTVNDTEEELRAIKAFLNACGKPERIELLPYHAMGEHKYAAIGKEAVTFPIPGREALKRLENILL